MLLDVDGHIPCAVASPSCSKTLAEGGIVVLKSYSSVTDPSVDIPACFIANNCYMDDFTLSVPPQMQSLCFACCDSTRRGSNSLSVPTHGAVKRLLSTAVTHEDSPRAV
ncbi:hypothetical protein HGRIS_003971 [Hohenbuehelia grisea]|uniref:Uncharacterized protein n=1 Tax=Hohenbuehelia grisea TaxID=104357 RepID=A0ABR3JH33_9AGAR